MATFVQIIEEDPAFDLIDFVADIKYAQQESKDQRETEVTALKQLATEQKHFQVIDQTLFSNLNAILARPTKDINTVFNLVFSLLLQLNADDADKLVIRLSEALTRDNTHARLKLKLLNTLFNILDANSRLRPQIFKTILELSTSSDSVVVLKGQFRNLDAWLKDWKLSPAENAEMYFQAHKISKVNGESEEEQKFLMKYFKALQTADEKTLAAAKPYAAQAAVVAIQSTVISESDSLLSLAAVKQLKGDAKYGAVYELLRIVAGEPVSAYVKFADENKGAIAQLGLDHEQTLSKMRTLTLCSIGEQSQIVTYASLQQSLAARSEDEVEAFVIEAVASGHVDAKLDQEKRVVYIQRTTARTFKEEQWEQLNQQLKSWRNNVRGVLTTLIDARGGDEKV